MKKIISLLCLSFLFLIPAQSFAANPKMASCNAEAKASGVKGDERKTFMKQCLGGGASDPDKLAKRAAKKEKSKACRSEAKASGKKGAERKAMVKQCMVR